MSPVLCFIPLRSRDELLSSELFRSSGHLSVKGKIPDHAEELTWAQ